MALVSYPIEDKKLLQSLRLTPFLSAAWSALNIEPKILPAFNPESWDSDSSYAGSDINEDGIPEVIDKIISTFPTSANSLPFMTELKDYFSSSENRTLSEEHINLIAINLKYEKCDVHLLTIP